VSLKRIPEVKVAVLSICLAKLVFLPYVPRQSWFHRCSKMQDQGTNRVNEETKQTNTYCCQKNLSAASNSLHNLNDSRFVFLSNFFHFFGRVGKKCLLFGFHFVLNKMQTGQVKSNIVLQETRGNKVHWQSNPRKAISRPNMETKGQHSV